jgi:hypothetical protein
MHAGRFSSHIDKKCSRYGVEENEVDLFFVFPLTKDAWFYSPWYLSSEVFATIHHSIHAIIQAVHSSGDSNASTSNLYTFLWCLCNPNDSMFRKANEPLQVHALAIAITQSARSDDQISSTLIKSVSPTT